MGIKSVILVFGGYVKNGYTQKKLCRNHSNHIIAWVMLLGSIASCMVLLG